MASTATADYPGMLPPPPGVTPNLTNPTSIAWKLIVASALCPTFAILFWLLRFCTSRFIVRKTYVDDWLIVVSLVFAIGLSIVDITQTKYGMCVHMWDVAPANFQHVIIVGIPASVFYNLSTLFVKASILSFYLRFAAVNRPFRIVVYILLFVIVGYSLNAGFSFLYLCTPMDSLWDPSIQGTCVDLYAAFLVSSVLNAVTDIVILLLPLWLLWPLRVRLGQKIAVALALMAGGFVCFVSFFRLASIPAGANDPDTTWVYCTNNIWCLVELYVGIICACLPSLKAFAKFRFPSLFEFSPDNPPHGRVNFSILTAISARGRRSKVASTSLRTINDLSGAASQASVNTESVNTASVNTTTEYSLGVAAGSTDQVSMV